MVLTEMERILDKYARAKIDFESYIKCHEELTDNEKKIILDKLEILLIYQRNWILL